MRRSPGGAIVAALVTAATAVAVASGPDVASAAPAEPYTWKNVRIDGGGFIPGIVFNPGEKDLVYARTDIGGAYRWTRSTQSWTPLLDWVGQDDWGHNGVLSIAADPVDTNRVYAAVGMYTNGWDPGNGAVLRSTDKGNTWQRTALPFKVGGNMPGRGMGERLAVDPRDNRNVLFAAEGGNGLWRSTDYGATWAKVSHFPNAGDYVADPADTSGYLSQNQGLTWVTFDPASTSAGCTATYTVTGQWGGGFQGEVTVKNTGTAATTGWKVGWTYTAGQTVTQSWGAATQSGSAVTVVNAGYNGTLASGASTTFGFLGGTTGTTNPVPSPITCSTTP